MPRKRPKKDIHYRHQKDSSEKKNLNIFHVDEEDNMVNVIKSEVRLPQWEPSWPGVGAAPAVWTREKESGGRSSELLEEAPLGMLGDIRARISTRLESL